MKYSILVTVVCVVNLFACIQMIKNIAENEPDGKRVQYFDSIITRKNLIVFIIDCWFIYDLGCLFMLIPSICGFNNICNWN